MNAIISSQVDGSKDLLPGNDSSQNGRGTAYPSIARQKLPVYPNANVQASLAVIATKKGKPLPDLTISLLKPEVTLLPA